MNVNDIGSVCSDCADKLGFVPKKKVCGIWIGQCEVCKKTKPCTDLWHDWERKLKVKKGETR